MTHPNLHDRTNEIVGDLVVERYNPETKKWICRCVCGNVTEVFPNNLGRITNSCGCRRGRVNRQIRITHGAYGTPEYKVWTNIKSRCYNNQCENYERYGARGIRVCAHWRNSFAIFLKDMGPRPGPEYTIERRDNEGDYTPENCYWATREVQARNKRNSHKIEAGGEVLTLSEWARRLGSDTATILGRLKRGWDPAQAVTTPIERRQDRFVEYEGQIYHLPILARNFRLPVTTLRTRLNRGWTIERALKQPHRDYA